MAAALDEDGEDGDISRVHAGDAARLGERLRMKLLQLLTALVAHGKTLVIVEPLWNDNGFVLLGPFGGFLFLLDVGRIMTHNHNFTVNPRECHQIFRGKRFFLTRRYGGTEKLVIRRSLTIMIINTIETSVSLNLYFLRV